MKCSICGEILTDIGDIKPDGEPICEKCNALSNTNSEEPPPVPTPEAKTFCRNHPTVEVDTKCADCGALICKTCSFPLKDENVLCQVCVQKPGANKKIPHPKPFPEGTMCSIHPGVPAELECQMCKVPICKTCCFEFPNNLHVCPNCINKPVAMSPKKRKNLIYSYALAVIGMLGFAFCMLIPFLFGEDFPEQLHGILFTLTVMAPGVAGISFAISAGTRNRKKSIYIWISLIWNALLVGLLLLLSIVGAFV